MNNLGTFKNNSNSLLRRVSVPLKPNVVEFEVLWRDEITGWVKVVNLRTGEEQYYSEDDNTPLESVVTSYAIENGLLTGVVHAGELDKETLPIVEGERTVLCGDWCTVVN